MDGPNPLSVAYSIVRALVGTERPRFGDEPGPDHEMLGSVLADLGSFGMRALAERGTDLTKYLSDVELVEPAHLDRHSSLAFWLNVYNAGALALAGKAAQSDAPSVLRVPGGFSAPFVTIAGESLSLDAIEHGKVRRFKDPRIHGALVCGSVSCPTLRPTPYERDELDEQLDHQMAVFLGSGAASYDVAANSLELSRVFLWYGGDFVRPHRMPTFIPARQRLLVAALQPWIPGYVAADASVSFQGYDWGLRCAVG